MAYGSIGTYLTGANSTSANVAVPGSTASGDTILVLLYWEGTGTVTAPAGFDSTAVVTLNTSPAARGSLWVYKKDVTGADSGTYNFTLSGATSWREGVAIRLTGRATGAGAIDVTPATIELTSAGTSITVPSQTTATAGCDLVFGITSFTGFTSGSFAAGFTARSTMASSRDLAAATQDNFTPAGATGTKAATGVNSGFLKAAVIAVAPAGAGSNTGTLSATLPKVTGSIAGDSTNPGTAAGTLPKVTAVITGTATNPGATSGTLPAVTGSLNGTSTNPGTTAATLPAVTGSVTGSATNSGTLAATLPAVVGSIVDTTSVTGTIAANLPAITGSIAGTATNPGTLAATLPAVTGSIVDASTNAGTLVGTLPRVTGSIAGTAVNSGTLLATFPKVTGSLDDAPVTPGITGRDLELTANLEPRRYVADLEPCRIEAGLEPRRFITQLEGR